MTVHRLPLIQPPEGTLLHVVEDPSAASSSSQDLMKVGDLAQEAGKTVRAIHLYE